MFLAHFIQHFVRPISLYFYYTFAYMLFPNRMAPVPMHSSVAKSPFLICVYLRMPMCKSVCWTLLNTFNFLWISLHIKTHHFFVCTVYLYRRKTKNWSMFITLFRVECDEHLSTFHKSKLIELRAYVIRVNFSKHQLNRWLKCELT